MNLEEAIRLYAFKGDRKKEEFLRTQKEVIAKAESAETVKANEKLAAEVQKQEEQELLRAAYKQPDEIREVRSGYRGAVRAQYATASVVTSMNYPASYSSDTEWQLMPSNLTQTRAQLEAEYKIKLKEEVERIRKEMRGESGQQVEIELLGQGRKFKLEGG